jgi:hypothetical protein
MSWKQLREQKNEEKKLNPMGRQHFTCRQGNQSLSSHRDRSVSYVIRTPSLSPLDSPRASYTLSRLNSTSIKTYHDDILLPIADCNLIIQHRCIKQTSPLDLFIDHAVQHDQACDGLS